LFSLRAVRRGRDPSPVLPPDFFLITSIINAMCPARVGFFNISMRLGPFYGLAAPDIFPRRLAEQSLRAPLPPRAEEAFSLRHTGWARLILDHTISFFFFFGLSFCEREGFSIGLLVGAEYLAKSVCK
jgi:hypothetical protein